MSILPEGLAAFFDRTSRQFNALHKPEWLSTDLTDSLWRIDNRDNLRVVSGKIKGGTVLTWNKDLPGGFWDDSQHAVILEQCKLVTIWAHDGVIGLSGNSLRTIGLFHNYLYWFVEFLVLRYGEDFRFHGFTLVGIDDLVDFLAAFEAGGVAGTSRFVERWESYLKSELALDPIDVAGAIYYLRKHGAYGADGRLKSKFVGAAMGVRSRRVRVLAQFSEYLTRYEPHATRRTFKVGRSDTANYVRWVVTFSKTLAYLPEFASTELSNTEAVIKAVHQFKFRLGNRTPTIPAAIGRKLLARCCHWMMEIYPKLIDFIRKVASGLTAVSTDSQFGLTKRISLSESSFYIDAELASLAESWRRTPSGPTRREATQSNMTTTYILLRLHNAVCYVLMGMLGCCRRQEVLDLPAISRGKVTEKSVFVSLRKSGVDNSRRVLEKPMPKIAIDCLATLRDLKVICKHIEPASDPLVDALAFFQLSSTGLNPLDSSAINGLLTELSLLFDLREENGEIWLLRSHELRRYFAMSFFHHGGLENALPALSWFMGHNNIEKTWTYIKESLTGREVSESEAAMATSAVYSDDQTKNVKILRAIVLKYFGCESMSMLSETEVHDYLEMMAEDGLYTARPVQIQCAGQKVFTIAISISGGHR